jgi:lipid-A-disaccharide synthase-like uncharacterized protein
MMGIEFWFIFGMFFQFLFFMRFVVQWIASERRKESYIPVSFWYFSLVGSIGLLIYAIYRKDFVFVLGLAGGSFVYVRNLIFIHKKNEKNKK